MDLAAIENEPVQIGKGSHVVTLPEGGAFLKLRDGRLRIVQSSVGKGDGTVLADAPFAEVTYSVPRSFFGNGLKLFMGEAGDWTVQPRANGLFGNRSAREWTQMFIDVLEKSGASSEPGPPRNEG